jgi:hypothetical protein
VSTKASEAYLNEIGDWLDTKSLDATLVLELMAFFVGDAASQLSGGKFDETILDATKKMVDVAYRIHCNTHSVSTTTH